MANLFARFVLTIMCFNISFALFTCINDSSSFGSIPTRVSHNPFFCNFIKTGYISSHISTIVSLPNASSSYSTLPFIYAFSIVRLAFSIFKAFCFAYSISTFHSESKLAILVLIAAILSFILSFSVSSASTFA